MDKGMTYDDFLRSLSIKDILVDDDVLKHVIRHIYAFVHQLEGREEDVLEELEFTVIAVRHIAAEH